MSNKPDVEAWKSHNAAIVDEFRANGGKVGGRLEGANMVLLTTTGAKSEAPRMVPLVYFCIKDNMLVIGSYAGADADPGWVHNLRAHPRAHAELGTRSFDVIARELLPADREPAWAQITALEPGFADYQAATSRVIPLFELQMVTPTDNSDQRDTGS